MEEATIASTHAAILAGEVTCVDIVEAYIERARAYNGVCTALVTEDGADIESVLGYVRAGSPLTFPTHTVAASTLFPDLDQYAGLPLDYGRMETTISDPSVYAQMGMRVGMPNAGQLNALETLNIRGERSVTCKGEFDAHPSTGPLPPEAPEVCEEFRQLPDALERAAELDALFGSTPDLDAMPMYCIVTAFKDPYDTMDMRSTSNNDVNFAMDAPPFDSPIVAALREQGAIIYAKSVAHEFNAGPGNPGGSSSTETNLVSGGQAISSWSGQSCNPYDTERVPRGSSSGSGVSVSANLVMVGICEQTGASCQGPASRNGISLLLSTKGLLPGQGGIGNQNFIDRPGIHARTLADAAYVFDAIHSASAGFYNLEDPFSAAPGAFSAEQIYSEFAITAETLQENPRPLEGVRIAIFREYMVKSTPNHEAISDLIDEQIKTVLRDQLGATLIEITHPNYPDDPDIPNAAFTFNDALAYILPRVMPEMFTRRNNAGNLIFDVPDWDVTSTEYLLALSMGEAPFTDAVRLTNFANFGALSCDHCSGFLFEMNRYLQRRGDERITDWAAWVENAKWRQDSSRAGAENWAAWDIEQHLDPGKADQLARSYVGRLALQMMMNENGIDLFVHPENTVPPPKIQGPNIGSTSMDGITPFLQIPRIVLPAGMTDVVYEPQYALNNARTNYTAVLPDDTPQTQLPNPLPISITFFANQGDEPLLIQVGTAYEAATGHRTPPPDFGPLE